MPTTRPHARPTRIDRHVGQRIRERRIMLGLTQDAMADLIGITYQQAHKYEKGINRIAAGRLYHIAQALGVEVGYFYEKLDLEDGEPGEHPTLKTNNRMFLELSRNVANITNRRHQEAIVALARALSTPSKVASDQIVLG